MWTRVRTWSPLRKANAEGQAVRRVARSSRAAARARERDIVLVGYVLELILGSIAAARCSPGLKLRSLLPH